MTTIDDHLRGKPAHAIALFQRFMAAVQACGPVDRQVEPKTIVLHGASRIFAAVHPTKDGLRGHLNLPYRVEDRRFPRIEPLTRHLFFHRFLLTSPDDLDAQFIAWIHDAYAVGQGTHREIPDR